MVDEIDLEAYRASLAKSRNLMRVVWADGNEVMCNDLYAAMEYGAEHGAVEIRGNKFSFRRDLRTGHWRRILEE